MWHHIIAYVTIVRTVLTTHSVWFLIKQIKFPFIFVKLMYSFIVMNEISKLKINFTFECIGNSIIAKWNCRVHRRILISSLVVYQHYEIMKRNSEVVSFRKMTHIESDCVFPDKWNFMSQLRWGRSQGVKGTLTAWLREIMLT